MSLKKITGNETPRPLRGKTAKSNRLVRFVDLNESLKEVEENFIQLPSNPQNGDALVYNSTSELWEAGSVGGGYTYEIGQYVPSEGGVVFHRYLDTGVENYLVIPITDQSTSQAWSNINNTGIGASAQSTWDGLSNSNAIVGQGGHTFSAASLCLDLVTGGKEDWYLPAIDELSLLWHNRFNVNKSLSVIGGATVLPAEAVYWSSTEFDANGAWTFTFTNGTANYRGKSLTYYVRAVRAFTI
jgi:hypothetical protein